MYQFCSVILLKQNNQYNNKILTGDRSMGNFFITPLLEGSSWVNWLKRITACWLKLPSKQRNSILPTAHDTSPVHDRSAPSINICGIVNCWEGFQDYPWKFNIYYKINEKMLIKTNKKLSFMPTVIKAARHLIFIYFDTIHTVLGRWF